jgi:hypothetical protein
VLDCIEFGIADGYQRIIKDAALDGFEPLMFQAQGTMIQKDDRQEVIRLELSNNGLPLICFLKRTTVEKTRASFGMLLRGLRPRSEPYREMQAIDALRQQRFSTMKVIAWGEQRCCGFPRRGFVLVEEVKGRDAQEMFLEGDASLRRRIIVSMGGLMGRLNVAGFFQAVRLKDVFCTIERQAIADEPNTDSSADPGADSAGDSGGNFEDGPGGDSTGDLPMTLIDRSAQWVWPKRFSASRCKTCLKRSARRFCRDKVILSSDEASEFASAYIGQLGAQRSINHQDILAMISECTNADSKSVPDPSADRR